MNLLKRSPLIVLIIIGGCQIEEKPQASVKGQLRIGFDIDDTILFSRDTFIKAPHMSDDPDHLDYGWVNTHDSLYSLTIPTMRDLIDMLRSQGHLVYFITARPGVNGEAVGRHLSRELGFQVVKDENLFFAPKRLDPETGKKFTTKHELITSLGLHIFYGDSDNDMVAASVAGIRGVRVVRDQRSVDAYSSNYFGDTKAEKSSRAPIYSMTYQTFLRQGVGPYGETIYPLLPFSGDD
jgi:acid phosphatase class B